MTDWKEKYEIAPWMVEIAPDKKNELTKISSADCFQIRSLSEKRFVKKIGVIEHELLHEIKEGLAMILSIT